MRITANACLASITLSGSDKLIVAEQTLKAYHTVCFKSLFGGVSLRIPRLHGCSCEGQDARARTVKIDGLVNWVSPELEFVRSQLAAMIPYARAAELMELLVPADTGV